jgi:hypothetical protein
MAPRDHESRSDRNRRRHRKPLSAAVQKRMIFEFEAKLIRTNPTDSQVPRVLDAGFQRAR